MLLLVLERGLGGIEHRGLGDLVGDGGERGLAVHEEFVQSPLEDIGDREGFKLAEQAPGGAGSGGAGPGAGLAEDAPEQVVICVHRPFLRAGAPPQVSAEETAMAMLVQRHCLSCHIIDGVGSKENGDLTHIGAKRTADAMAKQIANPKSVKPENEMPAFDGKLTPEATGRKGNAADLEVELDMDLVERTVQEAVSKLPANLLG